jgi:hypothetical protein
VLLKAATADAQSGFIDVGDDAANDLARRLGMKPPQHDPDPLV